MHELREGGPIHQGERFADLEGLGIVGEVAGGDENSTIRPLSGYDPVEFPDLVHTHLAFPPLLALNQDRFPMPTENEINAAICATGGARVRPRN